MIGKDIQWTFWRHKRVDNRPSTGHEHRFLNPEAAWHNAFFLHKTSYLQLITSIQRSRRRIVEYNTHNYINKKYIYMKSMNGVIHAVQDLNLSKHILF